VGNLALHNGRNLNNGFSFGGSRHTIRDNIALGNTRAGFGISGSGHTVSDNVASDNSFGFEISFSGQFTHNVANSNGGLRFNFGSRVGGIIINPGVSGLEIRRNAVIGNGGEGIQVYSSNVTITENNIFGNGTTASNCGLTNGTGTVLMAPNNFWGAASGPGLDPADAVCNDANSATPVDPVATKPFTISVKSGL